MATWHLVVSLGYFRNTVSFGKPSLFNDTFIPVTFNISVAVCLLLTFKTRTSLEAVQLRVLALHSWKEAVLSFSRPLCVLPQPGWRNVPSEGLSPARTMYSNSRGLSQTDGALWPDEAYQALVVPWLLPTPHSSLHPGELCTLSYRGTIGQALKMYWGSLRPTWMCSDLPVHGTRKSSWEVNMGTGQDLCVSLVSVWSWALCYF